MIRAKKTKGKWVYTYASKNYTQDEKAQLQLDVIVAQPGITPTDAQELIVEAEQSAIGLLPDVVNLAAPELTQEDKKILQGVRRTVNDLGNIEWLVHVRPSTNTYALCSDIQAGMEMAKQANNESYFFQASNYYTSLLKNNPRTSYPPFAPLHQLIKTNEDGTVSATTPLHFSKYLELVKPFVINDKGFYIGDICSLSNDLARPNFAYFDIASVTHGDTTSWESFETHFYDYEIKVFRAWLGSIVVGECSDTRALVLLDNGGGGKGTLLKILHAALGTSFGTFTAQGLRKEFAGKEFLGKRVMACTDCKDDPYILTHELIHQVTTGDSLRIEGKGADAYTAPNVYCRVLVATNTMLKIDVNKESDRRRFLLLELKPYPKETLKKIYQVDENGELILDEKGNMIWKGNSSFPKQLKAEWPAYLAKCLDAYAELCPDHTNIQIPLKMQETIYTKNVDEDSVELEEILKGMFEFKQSGTTRRTDFWHMVKSKVNAKMKDFKLNSAGQNKVKLALISLAKEKGVEVKFDQKDDFSGGEGRKHSIRGVVSLLDRNEERSMISADELFED